MVGVGTRGSLRSLPILNQSMILYRRTPKFNRNGNKTPLFLERILQLIPSLLCLSAQSNYEVGICWEKQMLDLLRFLSLFAPRLSYSIIIIVIIITHMVIFIPCIIYKLWAFSNLEIHRGSSCAIILEKKIHSKVLQEHSKGFLSSSSIAITDLFLLCQSYIKSVPRCEHPTITRDYLIKMHELRPLGFFP